MFSIRYQYLGALIMALSGLFFAPAADADHEVFRKVAPSSVLILVKKSDAVGYGSGSLIDKDAQVVLTAAHVVRDAELIVVVFPERSGGRIVTSASHYVDQEAGVEATVLMLDERRDTALLKVASVPQDMPAIPLASESPRPGESVFAVGNASFSEGGVFGLVGGMIRQVHEHPLSGVTVINSSIATNRGDSGGPVVTRDGKLVGIVSGGTTGSGEGIQLRDFSIDITEIRTVLASAELAGYGNSHRLIVPLVEIQSEQLSAIENHMDDVAVNFRQSLLGFDGSVDLQTALRNLDAQAETIRRRAVESQAFSFQQTNPIVSFNVPSIFDIGPSDPVDIDLDGILAATCEAFGDIDEADETTHADDSRSSDSPSTDLRDDQRSTLKLPEGLNWPLPGLQAEAKPEQEPAPQRTTEREIKPFDFSQLDL